ncbi:hypothetical protein EII38_04500 [Streptococcus minor]|uniref:Cytoplasmic protein n=1 Tax=Streptococcus minor TaxID=229549 RepID=A0A3P1VDI2_9STRE|nr:hypothetical protein [Streptococcus minor]RRD31490.1 hypothetical protein EII38_04500 [Streptococcus minor]
MKPETLVLKPEFVGKAIYEGFEQGPRVVNGKQGSYLRHQLFSEKHGIFHVITASTVSTIEAGKTVECVNPILFIDFGVNGRNVEPAKNVLAENLLVVK